jgi:hypothetical protein
MEKHRNKIKEKPFIIPKPNTNPIIPLSPEIIPNPDKIIPVPFLPEIQPEPLPEIVRPLKPSDESERELYDLGIRNN